MAPISQPQPAGGPEMMRVRNWMKSPIHSVKPRDNAQHARSILEKHRINQLPVLVNGKLVGIITDRDLRDAFPSVFEMAAAKKSQQHEWPDPETVSVESVMTPNVSVVSATDHIVDAARLMRKERIGAVPVVEDGRVVGILTRSDLLDALAVLASDGEPVR
jgi:acetoin utilization protein AcuB